MNEAELQSLPSQAEHGKEKFPRSPVPVPQAPAWGRKAPLTGEELAGISSERTVYLEGRIYGTMSEAELQGLPIRRRQAC